jgi:orotate phosphoribosyltransferase-like protein
MDSRELRVRELKQSGLSHRKIAKSLSMSLRDVTKYLANPVVDRPRSVTAPLPITVTNALPIAGLGEQMRALDWALDDSEKALRLLTADAAHHAAIFGPLRTLCRALRKQYPVAQPVTLPVSPIVDPLAVDPLTFL